MSTELSSGPPVLEPGAGAGPGGDDDLAVRLSESAREMQHHKDPDETLRAVVAAAVALIPGAEEGSITVISGRRQVQSEAASSQLASSVDALQQELGEGPCLDAVYDQELVCVSDTATDQRWPAFAARAREAGAASMLALQLFVDGDSLGALNLYGRRPGAFDEESEHVGSLFAAHAAIAYSAARRESELRRAVSTRELIGQAQGILMERHRISADQAFAMLVAASQQVNVKLREVADALVHTGLMPTSRSSGPASRGQGDPGA